MRKESTTKDVVRCWVTFGSVIVAVTVVGLLSNVTLFLHNNVSSFAAAESLHTTMMPSRRSLADGISTTDNNNNTSPATTNTSILFCHSNIAADPAQLQEVGCAALYIIGICIMFLCIHIVCEHHFVVAIEQVVESSSLSPDVVGATVMAAGTSAPELFASVMGVIFQETRDVGVGTVIGKETFCRLLSDYCPILLNRFFLFFN